MSAMEAGMETMLETFIHETATMLEQLDEILMESERAKNMSEDSINSIFRITHTIKSSSAMMGFNGVSRLSHAVEDVFYIIREAPSKLSIIYDTIFDLVFQASDFFKHELDLIEANATDYEESNPQHLIDKLEEQAAVLNGSSTASVITAPGAENAAEEEKPSAAITDVKTFEAKPLADGEIKIRVFFEDDCQMENMRAYMLLTQLRNCCNTLDSIPKSPETDGGLCAEIIKNGFLIKCKPTRSTDEVVSVISTALNVKSYEVLKEEAPAEVNEAKPQTGDAAKAAPAADTPKAAPASDSSTQRLISVNQSKLDLLMDLVGEIVTAESMVLRNRDLAGLKLDNFTKCMRELRKLTDELQDVVMSTRMVPLYSTFHKMERIVRDMSKKLNKQVDLVLEGGDTEVDKTINDAIVDPFMHMIRNSMDHGIESAEERVEAGKPAIGKLKLSAKNVGGEIFFDISDDGAGMDPRKLLEKASKKGLLTRPMGDYSDKEALGLIMLPGFSTNTEVTEYSGRGVGMDVVRKNIEKVGGTISISSAVGKGSTFTIKIPLTLAIVDGMNVSVGKSIFTIPVTSIRQSFKIADVSEIIHNTNGSEMIMIRGECYPILRLHKVFNIETEVKDLGEGIVILVEGATSNACIFADELLGEYQVVVKPFPSFFNSYGLKDRGISGCSVLGDGTVTLILDTNNLISQQ